MQHQLSNLRKRLAALVAMGVSLRRVAMEAKVDGKTVRNMMAGGDVRTATFDAIADAATRLEREAVQAKEAAA